MLIEVVIETAILSKPFREKMQSFYKLFPDPGFPNSDEPNTRGT